MANKNLEQTLEHLRTKRKVLLLTTSNRWVGQNELPKSTALAYRIAKGLPNAELIEIPLLRIVPCEGNISARVGNECGLGKALMRDKSKNPSGLHRCWASMNNPDDELWKVTKPLFESDCVLFFASVRWGQANSIYQKLIERLSWIENRHTTLGEESIVKGIDAGIILIGHNWRGDEVLKTQKQVLEFFGFNVVPNLCWNWSFTTPEDESQESYLAAIKEFDAEFM
jgi:hypothetical protein